ncbi:MAG: hypothetical protein ACE5IM_08555 [Nitrospinota bacterium]
MGKSRKKGRGGQPLPRKKSAEEKQSRSWFWMVAFGLAIVGFGGGYSLYEFTRTPAADLSGADPSGADPSGRVRAEAARTAGPWRFIERRPVLPAALFVGRVREAYAEAKRIPEVFDRLYCYCRCREGHGHKTLLTCYTVTHAST